MLVPLRGGVADLDARTSRVGGAVHTLTPNEADLLRYLATRPGDTVSQDDLLVEVFGLPRGARSRRVVPTVQRLRPKLERDPGAPEHLVNVFGRGYRFEPLGENDGTVGRADELHAVRTALADHPVLWVIAPGGFGKSRLVAQYASLFARDALSLDLTDRVDERGLARAVADALGLERLDGRKSMTLAVQHRSPDLIVLDAAEGLVGLAEELVQVWSAFAPVLVTSRLPGDGPSVRLGPLSPGAGRRLLLLRSKTAPHGAADRVVRRVGGVPLALELAASHVEVFGIEQVAPLLDDLGALLSGGDGRQASMVDVLAWSWSHTPAELQEALVGLAPARQGLARSDAEALAGGAERVGALEQWGWTHPRGDRVVVLEPVAEFVADQVDLAPARARHLAWFAGQVTSRREAIAGGAVPRFVRREWANIEAAVDHGLATEQREAAELVLAFGPALMQFAPDEQTLEWFDRAVAISEGALRADLLVFRGRVWLQQGSFELARADLDEAEAVGPSSAGALARRRAHLARCEGHLEASLGHSRVALAELRGAVGASARTEAAFTAMRLGRFDDAIAYCEEGRRMATASGATRIFATTVGTLGRLYANQGDLEQALDCYDRAMVAFASVDDRNNQALLAGNVGLLHSSMGDLEATEEWLTRSVEERRRRGWALLAAASEVNLGIVHLVRGDFAELERMLLRCLALFEADEWRVEAAYTRFALGRACAWQGRREEAEVWWQGCDDLPVIVAWLVGLGRTVSRSLAGDLAGAREALAAFEPPAELPEAGDLAEGFVAWAALQEGPDEAADEVFWRAVEVAQGMRNLDVRREVDALLALSSARGPRTRS